MAPKLAVLILTFNEEDHIERAILSAQKIASDVIVVDSYSSDRTVAIAQNLGAQVVQNEFESHAAQFNWGMKFVRPNIDWIFRLDADEVITPELRRSLEEKLPLYSETVAGLAIRRRIFFLEKPIKWGGVFPIRVVRIFRRGRGSIEDRLMDEHVVVDGEVDSGINGEICDISHHSISRWIAKHNVYASKEAFEVLNEEFEFVARAASDVQGAAGLKRTLKLKVYYRLPYFIRPIIYFLYRYLLRLGFLDGYRGFAFHFLQGYWYRYLVELKVSEVKRKIHDGTGAPLDATLEELQIELPRDR